MTLEELKALAMENALGQFLSEYPEDMEHNDVLELILDNDDRILVWEPFEHHDGEWLVDQIVGMADVLLDAFKKVAGIND